MMLECDNVVLFGLTMFKADFIYYAETEIRIKDVTKVNKFIGIGTTMHKFKISGKIASTLIVCLTLYQWMIVDY